MVRFRVFSIWLSLGVVSISQVQGQQPPAKAPSAPSGAATTPPATNAAAQVAAMVNGQPVLESAVQRGLKRVPPADQARARPEILNYLIDNMLIDQYLAAQKIPAESKEVDARIAELQAELKKHNQEYAKMLKDLSITEDELRAQMLCDIRWDKFANAQANEKVLKDMYAAAPEMFDGSQVRARHILIKGTNDAKVEAESKAKLAQIKAQIEADAAKEVAKLPATTDAATREQERLKKIEASFGDAAQVHSSCPSKKEGGDLNFFPRSGAMVEPFAKAAFALKPGQVSDVVDTQFGHHLILVTARKPGQATKFEEVKEEVKEAYCGRLRESMVTQLRTNAKIAITPPTAPTVPAAPATPAK